MRTVVAILKIISKCFGDKLGTVPCYNTLENWVKKLGLSVYEEDRKAKCCREYAMVIDESIMINKEKLVVNLGRPTVYTRRVTFAHVVSPLLFF